LDNEKVIGHKENLKKIEHIITLSENQKVNRDNCQLWNLKNNQSQLTLDEEMIDGINSNRIDEICGSYAEVFISNIYIYNIIYYRIKEYN